MKDRSLAMPVIIVAGMLTMFTVVITHAVNEKICQPKLVPIQWSRQ